MGKFKQWKTIGPRFDCPVCGSTMHMVLNSTWRPTLDKRSDIVAVDGNSEARTSNSPTVVRGTKTSSTERTHGRAVDNSATPENPSPYSPPSKHRDEDEGAERNDGA